MSAVTLLGLGTSLAALGWLTATDPKRRRAFRRPVVERRGVRLAWTAALLPGVLVPVWDGAGGFFVWFGAVSVAGWAVAAISPDRADAIRARLGVRTERLAAATGAALASLAGLVAGAAAALRRGFGRASGPGLPRRAATAAPAGFAELERRVRELEAEVARLRGAPPAEATVIELARPAARL